MGPAGRIWKVEQLAKALREEMGKRGHSYREAAMAMGVSSGSVVNWSKGWIEESPRTRNLEAMANYIGVPLYMILGWTGLLSPNQVEMLQRIPGSLETADLMALAWASQRGYLNSRVPGQLTMELVPAAI